MSRINRMGATAMNKRTCRWCHGAFRPRMSGGKPQRFCSPGCRRAFEAALRAWAQAEFAAGRITVTELQRVCCRNELTPNDPVDRQPSREANARVGAPTFPT